MFFRRNSLSEKIGDGEVFFDEKRFDKNAIDIFSNRLSSELEFFKNNEFDEVETFSFAVDIERALIERKFFGVFETDFVKLSSPPK